MLKNKKNFILTQFALRNKTSFLVLAVLITILGIISFIQLPKEDMPDIKFPYIFVNTIYPGTSPEDIELLITKPIERELKSVSDVKTVKSYSQENYSLIFLEFNPNVNINVALQKVRDAVNTAKADLPAEVKDPTVAELSFDKIPVMTINLSGPYSLVKLKNWAEKIQDKIDGVSGVLDTEIVGGLDKEVRVLVDIWSLNQYKLSLNDVVSLIGKENITIPGGIVKVGDFQYLLRVPGKFDDFSELGNLVLKSENNSTIYIHNIAKPVFGYKEDASVARYNQITSVSIQVMRKSGENIIDLSTRVQKEVKKIQKDLPSNIKINIIGDRSEFIVSMLNELINTIITGIILVCLILLFFMGTRNAIFVSIAIPISMFITFIIIRYVGYSLNMVVLFSLILVSGRLVDDAIVVVENIFRHQQEGETPQDAANHATAEVIWPVIASTCTTLSAFVPLLFWPGIMGEFMKYLPQVFMVAMAASLFVAAFISPIFCALFMRVKKSQLKTGVNANKKSFVIVYYEKLLRSLIDEKENLPPKKSRIFVNVLLLSLIFIALFIFAKFGTGIEYALHLNFKDSLIKILDHFGLTIFLLVFGFGTLYLLISKTNSSEKVNYARFKKLGFILIGILLIISLPFLDCFSQTIKIPLPVGIIRLLMGLLIIWAYFKLIRFFVKYSASGVRRSLLLHAVMALFFGIILTFANVDIMLFPKTTPSSANITIELPKGSQISKTDEIAIRVEAIVQKYLTHQPSNIKQYVSSIGSTGNWQTGSKDQLNMASIQIDFHKSEDIRKIAKKYHTTSRKISPFKTIEQIRKELKNITGAKITVQEDEHGPPTGRAVLVELSGEKLEVLKALTDKVKKIVAEEEGVVNLTDSQSAGGPELQIIIDREKAAQLGINTALLAGNLRTAINGTKASILRRDDEDKEIEINVKLNSEQRDNYNTLRYLPIPTMKSTTIPLSEIAIIKPASGYGSIMHVDFKRVVNIEADVSKESKRTPQAVINGIKSRLAKSGIRLPNNYTLTFKGQQEEQAKSTKFLAESFMIAIFLIALVLVSEFNSIVLPLIILFTVTLSIIGVGIGIFLGSLIFRGTWEIAPFVIIMTGVGIVTLAGIVVNNAIILLDYAIQLRKDGFSKAEAIIKAGTTRFRPVLLTASTTILGLVPMASGISLDFTQRIFLVIPTIIFESESSQFWAPLADAVIFGLTFATILTLVVVPVCYYILAKND